MDVCVPLSGQILGQRLQLGWWNYYRVGSSMSGPPLLLFLFCHKKQQSERVEREAKVAKNWGGLFL